MAEPQHVPAGRRIGLFGGSFDPVHTGHVALARCALDHLALDELRWIPAGQPWQKSRQLASAEHRVAMLQAVIADEPRFRLERCELERAGPSYTLDTVRSLQAAAPPTGAVPAEWFLIIGQDQYANFTTWHGWIELLQRVTLAVAAREGRQPEPPQALADVPYRCVVLPLPPRMISATAIRNRLAAGDSPLDLAPTLVAPAVASYIAGHRLYCGPA
ncbi:MAG: nicotinate (nicotinamide) nucleotide adenylyltransferase [Leptothrix sp. (in: b-proteobacteria)]